MTEGSTMTSGPSSTPLSPYARLARRAAVDPARLTLALETVLATATSLLVFASAGRLTRLFAASGSAFVCQCDVGVTPRAQ